MNYVAVAARVAVAGLALFTVYRAWWVDDRTAWDQITVQTAVIVALAFMWGAWTLLAERRRAAGWIEGAATTYALVQGVIFTFLVEVKEPPQAVLFGFSTGELLSLVVPAATLAVWLLLTPHRRIGWVSVVLWPLPLVAYIAGFVLRAANDPNLGYPYAFMDLDVLGWRGIVQNVLLYAGALVVASGVIVWIDHLLPTRTFLSGREH